MSRLHLHRALRLAIAPLLLLLAVAAPSSAQTAQITACNCLLQSGDSAHVSFEATNPTGQQMGLIIAAQLPSGVWFFLRPIGLNQSPGIWATLQPGQHVSPPAFLDMPRAPDSLPFGAYPIVPPFRYVF